MRNCFIRFYRSDAFVTFKGKYIIEGWGLLKVNNIPHGMDACECVRDKEVQGERIGERGRSYSS